MLSASSLLALARAAVRIHGQLSRNRSAVYTPELPTASWNRCRRLQDLVQLAEARGWHAAAHSCREQLRWALQDVRRQLDAALTVLFGPAAPAISSPREILDDLVALGDEFQKLEVNLREGWLSVVTEPIALEGVDLGRFEITLPFESLGGCSRRYTVTALEPNRAAPNPDVTHPHVNDEQLCEGEGSSAIRSALAQGRLLDFLTVVAQVLSSYNPGSAYVTLDDWRGAACSDCGDYVDEDDRSACERCGSELCPDCSCGCASCDRCVCGHCGAECRDCGEYCCHGCLEPCSGCQQKLCGGCLSNELCEACTEAKDDAHNRQPDSPPDAVCVGEARVSA